jgi:hypothetical protein
MKHRAEVNGKHFVPLIGRKRFNRADKLYASVVNLTDEIELNGRRGDAARNRTRMSTLPSSSCAFRIILATPASVETSCVDNPVCLKRSFIIASVNH